MKRLLIAASGAAALFAGAGSAEATLIDLTDARVWSADTTTADYANIGRVSLGTGDSDRITFSAYDGPTDLSTPLRRDFDGAGIGDDEITGQRTPGTDADQSLTMEFEQRVTVNGLMFLDLYTLDEEVTEIMEALFYDNGELIATRTFSGESAPGQGGYLGARFAGIQADGLAFRMADGSGLDDRTADAAVAGVSLVPIPPAVWLFGSALAGMIAIGRRRLLRG